MSYDNFNALMAELAEREMEKQAAGSLRVAKRRAAAMTRNLEAAFSSPSAQIAPIQPAGTLPLMQRAKAHLMANKGKYALGAGALGLGGAYLYNRRK